MNRELLPSYQALVPHLTWQPEPFEVVAAVEEHRQFWRPDKVKTILLAESHVYTTQQENEARLHFPALHALNCPDHFVRLVYCLGYGAGKQHYPLLSPPVQNNYGTPQYWTLLAQCLNKPAPSSLNDKLVLLLELKAEGYWLLDSFPIGLYGKDLAGLDIKTKLSEDRKLYGMLFDLSWKHYTWPLITLANPERILVVGKMVWNNVAHRLPQNIPADWIYQPNARSYGTMAHYDERHAPTQLSAILQKLHPCTL